MDLELLELKPTHRMDTWIPEEAAWVTHTLNSIRIVEKNQRLLYCVHRSLTDIVTDCLGLENELKSQKIHTLKQGNKRSAHEPVSPVKLPSLTKCQRQLSPIMSNADGPVLQLPVPTAAVPLLLEPKDHADLLQQELKSRMDPLQREPKDRAWPSDWMVLEIADGFDEIKRGRVLKPPRTQKELFPQLFGWPYHKATVCFVRKRYESASPSLQSRFCGYGRTHEGLWNRFVAATRLSVSEASLDNDNSNETSLSDAEKDVRRLLNDIGSHSQPFLVHEDEDEPPSSKCIWNQSSPVSVHTEDAPSLSEAAAV